MAIEVDLEKINGGSAVQHIQQGTSVTRIATVSGLATTGVTTGSLCQAAINAVVTIVGDRGSACPDIPSPNFLESFSPHVIGPGVVEVRISYKGLPMLQIEFGTTLSQVETNLDIDSHVLFVQYQYPSDYINSHPDLQGRAQPITQYGTIQRSIQETTWTMRYTVTADRGGDIPPGFSEGDGGYIPIANPSGGAGSGGGLTTATGLVMAFAQYYVGMINAGVWDSAPGAARTWLCESLRASSRDGGRSYEVSVTFHYRSDTWDFLLLFQDPFEGKTPTALIEGMGRKKVKNYKVGTLPVMPPTDIPRW